MVNKKKIMWLLHNIFFIEHDLFFLKSFETTTQPPQLLNARPIAVEADRPSSTAIGVLNDPKQMFCCQEPCY